MRLNVRDVVEEIEFDVSVLAQAFQIDQIFVVGVEIDDGGQLSDEFLPDSRRDGRLFQKCANLGEKVGLIGRDLLDEQMNALRCIFTERQVIDRVMQFVETMIEETEVLVFILIDVVQLSQAFDHLLVTVQTTFVVGFIDLVAVPGVQFDQLLQIPD